MMDQVPNDVLIDIFCRLPMKSLLICKVVCKCWRDILEQQAFIEAHLHRYYRTDFLHPILLHISSFQVSPGGVNIYTGNVCVVNIDDEGVLVESPNNQSSCSIFRGTCKGLVCESSFCCCLYTSSVRNPATHEYHILPRMAHVHKCKKFKFVLTGMGFDPVTGVYKVVQMWYSHRHGSDWDLEALIHVLGTPSWRKIRVGLDPVQILGRPGVFAGGALYWLAGAKLGKSERLDRIVSLDMNDESFRVLAWPDGPAEEHHRSVLLEWEGQLSVASVCDADDVEIWVLKGGEWIKQVRLEFGGVCRPPRGGADSEVFLCRPSQDQYRSCFDFESGRPRSLFFGHPYARKIDLNSEFAATIRLKDVGCFHVESHVASLATLNRYFKK